MQITEENRPICAKCKVNLAITLISSLWICGECFHKLVQAQEKIKQKMILEG